MSPFISRNRDAMHRRTLASIQVLLPIALLVAAILGGVIAGAASAHAQPAAPPAVSGGSYGSGMASDVIIRTDPETGSLIIIADDETHAFIASVLSGLDRPVPQVLIKVLFLEVTHSKGMDVGVDAFYTFDGASDNDVLETLFGVAALTTGGFYRILDEDFALTLRAMAEVSKLEVLSKPSVLARNNEEALITVGQEVPFIRNSRITDSGQTINTVEYEDIGIILRVTPYITPDDIVEMAVHSEISTLSGETVRISDTVEAPVLAKRSANTRVVVPDRQTVVIGGLMQDNSTSNVRKVPLLGDIPILGLPFRRKVDSNSKTELLIFLTPHVVKGGAEIDAMTRAERANAVLAPGVLANKPAYRFLDETTDPYDYP